jgi:hypothetical protein
MVQIQQPLFCNYRPISLCNVVYKVVLKCLVNRLMHPWSDFVPGRMIRDNALLVFECIHHIKQEKNPTKIYCAYKLDLSKAYDMFDWSFLKQVMQKLGSEPSSTSWGSGCTNLTPEFKSSRTLIKVPIYT